MKKKIVESSFENYDDNNSISQIMSCLKFCFGEDTE
jgi:hypothetical protein